MRGPASPGRSTSGASRASGTRVDRPADRGRAATWSSTDTAGIRRLAARMNAARAAGAPSVQAGEIGALGLLHEVGHLLIARYEADVRPGRDGRRAGRPRGPARSGRRPPARPVRRGVPGRRARARSRRAHRLEELLLTRVANENPAVGPLRELDRRPRARRGHALPRRDRPARGGRSRDGPPVDDEGTSLLELMRMPARRAPTSLAGQLRFIREHWGEHPRASASTSSSAGSTWPSASWPRRSARSICGSVAAGAAVRMRAGSTPTAPRRRRSGPPPRSPRRSRPTRPGCRASC